MIVSKFRNNNDDYNDCSEPVLEIHSEQPGYGKTQSMVDYINSNPHERHLVLGPSHDFLNELKERIGIRTKIFRGFERGCSRLQRGDKRVVDLYKKLGNSSPTLICKVLRCKGRCSYRNQFSQLKNKTYTNCVFMPLHFLFYTDIDFNSFDNIFVEEGIKSNSFSNRLKADYLNEILKLNIKNEDDKAVLNSVRDCILDNDHVKFYELTNKFSRIVYNHNISVLNDGRGKWDNICNINVNELYYNLIFNKIGNLNVEIMWEWIIFYKQMISWKNIVYNCASFNRYTFTHKLRMFREIFPEYKPKINLHKTQFSNPGTKIIRMSKDRTIYKNWMLSYYDEYSDKLWKLVKNNKYNHNMRVCFLTYKYMIENKLDIKGLNRENNIFGSHAFWFGAGHGINTYEGFDVLIVFGDI
ncbi:MAG: hypothetical protein ACLFMM_02170 [Methanohalobium sp.]|uniref:hypothetical protein n=1 Tax=Methanohalobium sp. TaxID=2837493 RepID=UPI00397ACCF7